MAKWVFSEGFWGSFAAYFVFTIVAPILLCLVLRLGKVVGLVAEMRKDNRISRWLGLLGTLLLSVVFVIVAFTMHEMISFAKLCWWEGFWNTMMSIGAAMISGVSIVCCWVCAVIGPICVLFALKFNLPAILKAIGMAFDD
jgi:hypothetical protein